MAWFKRGNKASRAIAAIAGAPAIEFVDVVLRREQNAVFNKLSFTIDQRRVGIVGDNGSGKSTLARLLNGLLLPDSGQVKIFGHDSADKQSALPSLVGFLFQNPDHQILFPTVLEELAFGLMQLGSSQADAEGLARAYLSERGCEHWADRPAQSLSEGEKQRLCLWSVLLMHPRLLVLDETFANLDIRSRNRLMRELEEQRQQLLMITHDLELLQGFDRVLWLHQGEIRSDGDADTVIESYRSYSRQLE